MNWITNIKGHLINLHHCKKISIRKIPNENELYQITTYINGNSILDPEILFEDNLQNCQARLKNIAGYLKLILTDNTHEL